MLPFPGKIKKLHKKPCKLLSCFKLSKKSIKFNFQGLCVLKISDDSKLPLQNINNLYEKANDVSIDYSLGKRRPVYVSWQNYSLMPD